MQAVIWTQYGPPEGLQLQEIDKPTPKDNEILIKIHAATVTAGDCEVRRLDLEMGLGIPLRLFAGIRKPVRLRILGQEMAGEVEAVGKDVTRFKVGDAIFGPVEIGSGAYAEYTCLPENAPLAFKPTNMSFDEAATIPTGGIESTHFLRLANIQPGTKLLINGAGGSIGTYGVQLARHFGAEVTAVDSGPKLAILRSLGADHVIDYTQEDFAQNEERYDVIFDIVGKHSFARSMRVLKPDGHYLLANPSLSAMIRGFWISRTSGKTITLRPSNQTSEILEYLKDLIESGVLKPMIDRRYPLEQTAEAHRYVESGQKMGNVVITIAQ